MSRESSEQLTTLSITDAQVAAWLLENSDFFIHHAWLLEHLSIPHECGAAVSLVERQVAHLRQANRNLRRQIDQLVQIARTNDALLSNIHAMTLALLRAETLEDGVTAVEECLRDRFQAEWVALRFFLQWEGVSRSDLFVAPYYVELFQGVLESQEPYIGMPAPGQADFLFPGKVGIRSCALVPLCQNFLTGILGIGSSDRERFCPGLGKVFLTRLGEVIGVRLETLLQAGNHE